MEAGLFAGVENAPTRRRNSSAVPGKASLKFVADLDDDERSEIAAQMIDFLGLAGIDRDRLAGMMGLSRSATRHWHNRDNSISKHNLAVMFDIVSNEARGALRMAFHLKFHKFQWASLLVDEFGGGIPRDAADIEAPSQAMMDAAGAAAKAVDFVHAQTEKRLAGLIPLMLDHDGSLVVKKATAVGTSESMLDILQQKLDDFTPLQWKRVGARGFETSGARITRMPDTGGYLVAVDLRAKKVTFVVDTLPDAFEVAHDVIMSMSEPPAVTDKVHIAGGAV